MRILRLGLALGLVALVACVGPEDDPSSVHDLRVLGAAVSPPELMAPSCDWAALVTGADPFFTQPVRYTALVADPAGQGRSLDYELFACPSTDQRCPDDPQAVSLARGQLAVPSSAHWAELEVDVTPAAAVSPDGTPVLARVLSLDTYRGLGGVRLPLGLHLRAGSEESWAIKLMTFNCAYFPGLSAANAPPVLPGVTLEGRAWGPTELPTAVGPGGFAVAIPDFSATEESYAVPGLDLTPVQLKESWRIAWFADSGTFSPATTGGVDLGGQTSRNASTWTPGGRERDVQFWFVVRDGRGGESWLARKLHYRP